MRVRRIIGSDSKAEWIDKTAAALDSTYDVLAAESHNRQDGYLCDDTAAGQLIVLGELERLCHFRDRFQQTSLDLPDLTFDIRHLEFIRWLVQTGKLSDW